MKKVLIAILLLSPLSANAVLIDGPSGPVSFGGSGITVDIVSGADITADGFGRSLSFSGFDHIINISGGILQGGISFSGIRHLFNITGGSIGGNVSASGLDHVFNFTGCDLILEGNNVSGLLLDGSPVDINVSAGSGQQINIIDVEVCPVDPADPDGDGVSDADDLCPDTDQGDPVDAVGCSDAQVDADGDGVCDPNVASGGPSECAGVDMCDNTMIPESVPTTGELKPNHWALTDGFTWGTVTEGNGNGPGRSYTIGETAGCSCEQIIEEQGLGNGHTKFGCSISAMDDWVDVVNMP